MKYTIALLILFVGTSFSMAQEYSSESAIVESWNTDDNHHYWIVQTDIYKETDNGRLLVASGRSTLCGPNSDEPDFDGGGDTTISDCGNGMFRGINITQNHHLETQYCLSEMLENEAIFDETISEIEALISSQ